MSAAFRTNIAPNSRRLGHDAGYELDSEATADGTLCQLAGRNGLPRQAGALVEPPRRSEMMTSTAIVAR